MLQEGEDSEQSKPRRQIILKKHKNKDQPMTLSSKFSGLVMDDEEDKSSTGSEEEEEEEESSN